jgi:hypothetical protein
VRATPATPKVATPATPDEIPAPWALLGINTDVLCQLQERAARLTARNAELASQLREYATGVRAGVVLEEGKRYVYRDGELRSFTRSVGQRAE